MSFVVDCSVAARWLLPDKTTGYTNAVFDLLSGQDAVVPTLFLSGLSNVFLKPSRQRKLSTALALSAVQKFAALGLEVERSTPDAVVAWQASPNVGSDGTTRVQG